MKQENEETGAVTAGGKKKYGGQQQSQRDLVKKFQRSRGKCWKKKSGGRRRFKIQIKPWSAAIAITGFSGKKTEKR